ncbi:SDR family NAD(P)-dependent oxidoreductase [Bailinhaonella thermotolerans]|uniref:SDR family NAD(P)-dependent oxidoreductase n=1 Tax=Bailinhaonella thermotolerans TaxID=1070861 RepID=A0A3A4AYG9_9ACTN|nr:SDR family NAD(P)-dependent oxidoreductase [Bailinhaonella thermotolerans]RJL34163.1 SDR family NAD(P)-dependent oxidoreductase [Bailinhaonella thermotolerans]
MPDSSRKTAVVIGAGPGLGMSVAHRFGREGYDVALVSRTGARHGAYLASLAEAGVGGASFPADVRDPGALTAALDAILDRHGRIDLVYYGPGSTDPDAHPVPIASADAESARRAMSWVYPALDVTGRVLPGMLERGEGGLLFATGISAVMPLPALGNLAISSAALRNYALTLHADLAGKGVYAGVLTIGGVIERGDVHRLVMSDPGRFGGVPPRTLDPDDIADAAWKLCTERSAPEATFSVFS